MLRLRAAWASEPYCGAATHVDIFNVALGSEARRRYILPRASLGTPTPFTTIGNGAADASKWTFTSHVRDIPHSD